MMQSRLYRILERLKARFDLEDSSYAPQLELLSTILLTTDVDALLAEAKIGLNTIDLTGAAGTHIVAFTVPVGKRWTVLWGFKSATTGNSLISMSDGTTVFYLTAPATSDDPEPLGVVLEQRWTFGLLSTGNAGDGAIICRVHYLEEDAF